MIGRPGSGRARKLSTSFPRSATMYSLYYRFGHCEEHSDEAIQSSCGS
jgi:hypothetical protein